MTATLLATTVDTDRRVGPTVAVHGATGTFWHLMAEGSPRNGVRLACRILCDQHAPGSAPC